MPDSNMLGTEREFQYVTNAYQLQIYETYQSTASGWSFGRQLYMYIYAFTAGLISVAMQARNFAHVLVRGELFNVISKVK